MKLKGIQIPKCQADKLKELARDNDTFRCSLLTGLVIDLSNEIPDYDKIKHDTNVHVAFKELPHSIWRKIERHATMTNTSPTQLIKSKINRFLKDK